MSTDIPDETRIDLTQLIYDELAALTRRARAAGATPASIHRILDERLTRLAEDAHRPKQPPR